MAVNCLVIDPMRKRVWGVFKIFWARIGQPITLAKDYLIVGCHEYRAAELIFVCEFYQQAVNLNCLVGAGWGRGRLRTARLD